MTKRKDSFPPMGSNGWPTCRVCFKDRPHKTNGFCDECRPRLPGTSYSRHKEAHRALTRRHYAENRERYKERSRNGRLLRKYGITPQRYAEMVTEQLSLCAICGQPGAETKGGIRLAVDHCHATGAVRGLLCFKCNSLLGLCDDSVAILGNAIAYLAQHAK